MGKGQSKSVESASTPNEPWRTLTWSEKTEIFKELEDFKPHSESNSIIRILLYGPIGAGKSCFINSVQRVLLGRNSAGALEQGAQMGKSFTNTIRTHKLKRRGGGRYPIALTDITGLHAEDGRGIQCEDIIKVLEGHIADGYTFNPEQTITENHQHYNQNPELQDKVHCLVTIIPADAVSRIDSKVIEKMKTVRQKARDLNIPQVIVLTKVDQACLMVNKNLRMIYHSRKIKEKVDESYNKLGIPLNKIYPVKNYHAEITQNEDNDVLILMALRDIVNFANDFLEDLEDREGLSVDY
ncbi:interferon-induced protein 44-like [Astyanax mexicanus]|uniref:Interferon-induced protein 44-like n=1 Tax=Astyanax mexicanus TaxID=7994 RepID=A0A3B1ICN7_ASTMX|nr:interferon-induced protein 44-like [Astyanax mexicanus]